MKKIEPTSMPPGWGFGKPRAPKPMSKPAARTRTTLDPGRQRRLHFKFALWAMQQKEVRPGVATDTFDICYESARRMVDDWNQVINEEQA